MKKAGAAPPPKAGSPGTSNHQKYAEMEKNPLLRRLLGDLYAEVGRRMQAFGGDRVLDAGCGEGHALDYLKVPPHYLGIDVNPDCIAWCRQQHPDCQFEVGSVDSLSLKNRSFEVVLCLEVLEHVRDPAAVLRELARVADRGVVLSVPFEPIFQLGNLLRGKYRQDWGNHPEHVQHWGYWGFRRFLMETGLIEDLSLRAVGPWLVASGRPHR